MIAVRQSQPGAIHPILVRQSCSGQSAIKDLRLLYKQAVHILLLLLLLCKILLLLWKILLLLWKILLLRKMSLLLRKILLLRLHILRVLWVLLREVGCSKTRGDNRHWSHG